jgi:hypothetical protein
MEVTALTRINATEPAGPHLGNTSDGSFQDAIDRAAEGYKEPEADAAMLSDPNALVPTALAVAQSALRERPVVKLGPAAVAASGAPDTVLKAVRDAGERVMSVLRSASGALSVESLAETNPTEVAVEPVVATSDLPSKSTSTIANTAVGVAGNTTLDTVESAVLKADVTSVMQDGATSDAAIAQSDKSSQAPLLGDRTEGSLADSSIEKSTTSTGAVQDVTGGNAEPASTDVSQNSADFKGAAGGQDSSTSTISTPGVQRGASRPVTGESALEAYTKFETAQGAWKPLWVSRAAKSLSARVETSVGPITMRLERGIDGNVTDVVAPEVLRGAIERGLASDANDLLDKDTQYRWRYVREHNEQREKPRQQESGDNNE